MQSGGSDACTTGASSDGTAIGALQSGALLMIAGYNKFMAFPAKTA
jgi:hypothetical protein